MPTWLIALLPIISAILADIQAIISNPSPTPTQLGELQTLLDTHVALSTQLQRAAGMYLEVGRY